MSRNRGTTSGEDSAPASPPTFAAFVESWNADQGQSTPLVHRAMADWLAERWSAGDRRLALLAFRSSGKSTLCGLFAAWLLSVDPNLRILVLSAEGALARKMARNIKRVIERHPASEHLRPASRDEWASDRFTVARAREFRDPSVISRGIAGNLTGSRADIVICDDVEVPNTSDTPGKRVDLRERLAEVDYIVMPGGLRLFLGTPHGYFSIYAAAARAEIGENAPFLAGFTRLELPLLDAGGRNAWPERFTPEHVAEIERRTGPAKFRSQMLLLPMDSDGGRLDPDRLIRYDGEIDYREGNRQPALTIEGQPMVSASCHWDPSFGGATSEASVVAAVFTGADGHHWLHRIRYLDPLRRDGAVDEATQACRQVMEFARDLHLPAVTVEVNGLGRFLPGILRRELAAARVMTAVRETSAIRAKHARILDGFDAVLAAGRLHAHSSVWESQFIAEMREWRPRAGAADDGLDAVSQCLLAEPIRIGFAPPPRRRDWRPGREVQRAESIFDP